MSVHLRMRILRSPCERGFSRAFPCKPHARVGRMRPTRSRAARATQFPFADSTSGLERKYAPPRRKNGFARRCAAARKLQNHRLPQHGARGSCGGREVSLEGSDVRAQTAADRAALHARSKRPWARKRRSYFLPAARTSISTRSATSRPPAALRSCAGGKDTQPSRPASFPSPAHRCSGRLCDGSIADPGPRTSVIAGALNARVVVFDTHTQPCSRSRTSRAPSCVAAKRSVRGSHRGRRDPRPGYPQRLSATAQDEPMQKQSRCRRRTPRTGKSALTLRPKTHTVIHVLQRYRSPAGHA